MILDETLEFSDAGSIINAAGTYLLGDVVPLSVARDVGGQGGTPDQMYFDVTVDTTVVNVGGTVQFKLVSADDAAITVNVKDIIVSKAFADGELVAGNVFRFPLPPTFDYSLYLGVQYVVATAAVTAGKVNAFLTRDQGTQKAYPSPSQYV
jgi:hypothetical protein